LDKRADQNNNKAFLSSFETPLTLLTKIFQVVAGTENALSVGKLFRHILDVVMKQMYLDT